MNPFDELSIEEAVRLRERKVKPVDDILAFSAGSAKSQDVLRTAMAMGADRALHLQVDEKEPELEPLGVAKVLKKVVEDEGRNLVILGKQSIDDDSGQTGQMLAGLLGWPQATQASKVEVKKDSDEVLVTREVDGGRLWRRWVLMSRGGFRRSRWRSHHRGKAARRWKMWMR